MPVAFVEVVFAFPLPAWFYANLGVALVGFPLSWGKGHRRDRRVVALFLPSAFVLLLYVFPWSTRKPFLRHLYSIKPGMSVAEVRQRMVGYMEGTGFPSPNNTSQEFEIDGAIVFRHSNYGQFNADWGIVYFIDGRVVSVDFSPD